MVQGPPPGPIAPENTSGQGPSAVVPPEIQGWNWGAFLLNGIWAIVHKAWLGLVLSLVLNLVGAIYCGLKGNELAWQNNRYESVEQFKEIQGKWTKWGVIILCISVALGILMMVFAVIIAAVAGTAANQ